MDQQIHTLPEKFLEKLSLFLTETQKQQVLEAFTYRNPSTFRANTLKITAKELQEALAKLGIEAEPVTWYPDAFILKNVPQRVLSETTLYAQGYLYIQGLSSMIPPLILDPQPNEKILDICAAPGSKTTQIANIMSNTGEILANDKSHIRNFKLKANLALQGVTNTKVSQWAGESIWKTFPEFFDRVLVDVPCSMEGRFYVEDSKTYRDWSPNKVKLLAETQKYLLRSAISSTKIGRTIVYSTCTLSPEENELVIDWILKKEGDAIALVDATIADLPTSPALLEYKGKALNPQLQKAFRILPSKTMEGFFIAKIKKLTSTVVF